MNDDEDTVYEGTIVELILWLIAAFTFGLFLGSII